jgi:hypothetical protein
MVVSVKLPSLLLCAGAISVPLLFAWQQNGATGAQESLTPVQLHVGGATIEVAFDSGNLDLPGASIERWVTRAAEAVSTYYGRFPLQTMRLLIYPAEGRNGVFQGTTHGYRGGFTRISLGQHTTQAQLDSDWMLTHEFTHLAFRMFATSIIGSKRG